MRQREIRIPTEALWGLLPEHDPEERMPIFAKIMLQRETGVV
jgi:hypothetical protein